MILAGFESDGLSPFPVWLAIERTVESGAIGNAQATRVKPSESKFQVFLAIPVPFSRNIFALEKQMACSGAQLPQNIPKLHGNKL